MQKLFLLEDRIDKNSLTRTAFRQPLVQRTAVLIPAPRKLFHQCLMSHIQRACLPHPAQGFRMTRVPAFPTMFCQNIPKPMQLPMLREQMFTTEMFWMYVPNAHRVRVSTYSGRDEGYTFSLLIFSSNSRVAFTEGLSVCRNTIRLSYRARSAVKNSSPQEGENVTTPSKSTSIVSLSPTSLSDGKNAAHASLPAWRETNNVPNFLRYIFILKGNGCKTSLNSIRRSMHRKLITLLHYTQLRIAGLKNQSDRMFGNDFSHKFKSIAAAFRSSTR